MTRKTFKKLTTSSELWEQVESKNKKLIEQFLREKNTRSSDSTLVGYESDLEIFFTWNLINNNNKFFVNIRKLEFSEFFSYATSELQWGSARFSRMRSVLSSLSNFIEKYMDDDYPDFRNVILKAIENMPKNASREKTILKEEQINYLFNYLEENGEYQIACWLALAIGSGSRFSELLRFTTDIIDIKNLAFNDIFIETSKTIKTKGRTKQGKMLTKYIIKDIFWDKYQKWLEIRKQILDKNKLEHNHIFIKINGEPAQEAVVRGWVTKIENILEVPFYPHSLRHYTTTYLSKMGLPYNLIKDIFGWEGIGMVEVYDDLTAKDKSWAELDEFKKVLDNKKIE
jgi:site-specific recombinase XerD